MSDFILALDQGTSSSRALLFDRAGALVALAQQPLRSRYPHPEWVEQDPEEIWQTQLATARAVLAQANLGPRDVAAIGIANQRETTLLWDRAGRPIANAIGWQDRRTTATCEALRARGLEPLFRSRTGLLLDPYFSGTKVQWLLDHVPDARRRAAAGDLYYGTVDSWLLCRLTGAHATDCTNASRTLLYDLAERRWDAELLEALDIPPALLPPVYPSSHVFGETTALGGMIPVASLCGDQQAALFGQAAVVPGMAKKTYGTGAFLLMNVGARPVASDSLVSTSGWGLEREGREEVAYALEGSMFAAGAAVQWLRDELGLIGSAAESEALAASVPDANGVYLVPAFVGLGAPHWDPYARGAIFGLTRTATRAHLARATLEAMAYQTRDVIAAVERDSGVALRELRVDGGVTANDLFLQLQADILGRDVVRPAILETTALGAAYLAGLAVGFWRDVAEVAGCWRADRRFEPRLSTDEREARYAGWQRAVERVRGWATPGTT